MKKILLLGALVILASCSKDDGKAWNSDAMFALNPDTSVRSSRAEGHLTPLEIVQQAGSLRYTYENKWFDIIESPSRGFHERQRDYVNQRLMMFGFDIIYYPVGSKEPTYKPNFIEAWDMVLESEYRYTEDGKQLCDTIAYIPNSVLRAAKEIIKPAFERGDFDTCYKAFDEAFTFIPITGAEWRALKAKDEN